MRQVSYFQGKISQGTRTGRTKGKRPAGASRRRSLNLRRKMLLVKKMIPVAVFAGCTLAVGIMFVSLEWHTKLKNLANPPVSNVHVSGDFLFLEKEIAQRIVSSSLERGFLDIDINNLKNQLEENPWVDSVSVARRWPDALSVEVFEQQPIARWGTVGFLNNRGEIVRVPESDKLVGLPYLQGDDRHAETIMNHYLRIRKLFAHAEMGIASVAMDSTRAWQVQLDTGITLKLGREQTLEKLQHFLTASRGVLAERLSEVHSVDMRYQNGFSVTWKMAPDQSVAMTGG